MCVQPHIGDPVVRTDGHVTITSLLKFLGLMGYQICLAMVLRWRATRAGSTTLGDFKLI